MYFKPDDVVTVLPDFSPDDGFSDVDGLASDGFAEADGWLALAPLGFSVAADVPDGVPAASVADAAAEAAPVADSEGWTVAAAVADGCSTSAGFLPQPTARMTASTTRLNSAILIVAYSSMYPDATRDAAVVGVLATALSRILLPGPSANVTGVTLRP
jgi:hypothetical protein